MQATPEDLRQRMARCSVRELHAVLDAPAGEYTQAAIDAARAEFESRPDDAIEPGEREPERAGWSVGESVRGLVALLLIWISWVALLAACRLSFRIEGLPIAVGFAAFGAALMWVSHRVSEASRRLVWVVPLLFGTVHFVRSAFAQDPGEPLFAGTFLVLGGLLALLLQRVVGRRGRVTRVAAG